MDEMWPFVGSKENKAWMGLAMDEATREIVGFDLGDRTR
ncbi:MAG: IS1 family transposase, partial [Cyanobacteria bacterium SW_5_48_44]